MIVATKDNRQISVKSGSIVDDWPWSSPPPASWLMGGQLLSANQAVGLPALLAALLLLADTVSMLPTCVYRRMPGGWGEEAIDSDQWDILHDRPNADTSPGAFRADIVLSLAAAGNAFIRKWKARGVVKELEVLDVRYVRARRQAGQVVFDDYTVTGDPGDALTRTSDDIIHLRLGRLNASSALAYSPEGIAPITAARMAFALGLKRQQFEAAYYDNDARPGVVMKFPQTMDEEQAKIWVNLYEAQHKGLDKKHRIGVAGGGADLQVIPISLKDAQFVEGRQLTTRDTAAIYRIPSSFLGDQQSRAPQTPDVEAMRLVRFGIGPYLTILDEGLSRDRDLFPKGSNLYVKHFTDALLWPDMLARFQAWTAAKQGGWMTGNEIRRREPNLPPIDGGDELQQTPVGGAPNPISDAATATDPVEQEEDTEQ